MGEWCGAGFAYYIRYISFFRGWGVNKLGVKLGGDIDNWGEGGDLGNVKKTKETQWNVTECNWIAVALLISNWLF